MEKNAELVDRLLGRQSPKLMKLLGFTSLNAYLTQVVHPLLQNQTDGATLILNRRILELDESSGLPRDQSELQWARVQKTANDTQ